MSIRDDKTFIDLLVNYRKAVGLYEINFYKYTGDEGDGILVTQCLNKYHFIQNQILDYIDKYVEEKLEDQRDTIKINDINNYLGS